MPPVASEPVGRPGDLGARGDARVGCGTTPGTTPGRTPGTTRGIRGGRGALRPGAPWRARAGTGSRARRGVLVICHESMVTGAAP